MGRPSRCFVTASSPLRDGKGPKTRLRWQAERPDALWHGDVCHGPTLTLAGRRTPVRIHALLDDASRYVVAFSVESDEREDTMLGLLVRALRLRGAPEALYDEPLAPVAEVEGQRIPLRSVDAKLNAHLKRPPRRPAPTPASTQVDFDPAGALLQSASRTAPLLHHADAVAPEEDLDAIF